MVTNVAYSSVGKGNINYLQKFKKENKQKETGHQTFFDSMPMRTLHNPPLPEFYFSCGFLGYNL